LSFWFFALLFSRERLGGACVPTLRGGRSWLLSTIFGAWLGLWAVSAGKYGVEVLQEDPGYEGLFGEEGREASSGGVFEKLVDRVAGKDSSVSDGFPDGRHGSVLLGGDEF
jgi:hypothetical protein